MSVLSFDDLMEKWQIDHGTLLDLVVDHDFEIVTDLPDGRVIRYSKLREIEIEETDFHSLVFPIHSVDYFEQGHPEIVKELRESWTSTFEVKLTFIDLRVRWQLSANCLLESDPCNRFEILYR